MYFSESDGRHSFPRNAFKGPRRRVICKERRCASPREGLRQSWTEWQVVEGRRVVSRHDTERQALDAMAKLPPL